MRSLLVLCLLFTAELAHAEPLELRCNLCRDPHKQPTDFGNFAFNSVFGSQATVSRSDGSRMKIVNSQGRWAMVELDHKLNETPFTFSIGLVSVDAVTISPEVQIKVYADTGLYETYPTVPSGSDLIVGPVPEHGSTALREIDFLDPPIRDYSGGSGGYVPYRPLMSYPGTSSKTFVIVGPSY